MARPNKKKSKNFKALRSSRHFNLGVLTITCLLAIGLGYLIYRSLASGLYIPDDSGPDRFGMSPSPDLISSNSTVRRATLDDYKGLGVRWIRGDFTWPSIQRTSSSDSSTWNWGPWDSFVQDANARGLRIMGMATYVPSWATSYNAANLSTAYGNFLGAAAKRYNGASGHGRVEAWELWNEPNIIYTWPNQQVNLSLYAQMVKKAHDAIKVSDSSQTVVLGGLSPWGDVKATDVPYDSAGNYNPVNYLGALYSEFSRDGYGKPFDAVGWHPYCDVYPVPSDVTWCAWYQLFKGNRNARSVMTANSDQSKKVWLTEFGYPTQASPGDSFHVTEQEQANNLATAYIEVAKYAWAGPLFWHSYKDDEPYSYQASRIHYEGIIRYDGTKKPAYSAYRTLGNLHIAK